jgi:NAD(P)-dependent dehydrogenase (short-subunit alcohol dehydrogenase family)
MSDAQRPLALVTGASRGIGRAAAAALTAAGWHVIAVGRSQKALEALDDETGGKSITIVPLDLKDLDGIDRLGAAVFERWRKLDGLVAAAGVLGDLTPAFQARPAMLQEVTTVNYTANARLIRSLDPLLRLAPAGRAVFLTDGVARAPRGFYAPYGASKAALEYLVQAYARDIAVTPIKVNLLDPGPVRTLLRAKAFPGEDLANPKPPEAVAPAILDLLSPACTRHGEIITL